MAGGGPGAHALGAREAAVRRAARVGPIWLTHFVLMVAALAVVAALSPAPSYLTDRDTYEQIGRELIVRDCSSLHCSRKLVAWRWA